MTPFKTLFSPFRIGNMKLNNRIVMPPMAQALEPQLMRARVLLGVQDSPWQQCALR